MRKRERDDTSGSFPPKQPQQPGLGKLRAQPSSPMWVAQTQPLELPSQAHYREAASGLVEAAAGTLLQDASVRSSSLPCYATTLPLPDDNFREPNVIE